MRKLVASLVAVVAIAGCGSLKGSTAPQTKQAEAQAERIATACASKGGGLKAMVHCAIPPHHGLAFLRCVAQLAPSTTTAVEADLLACGERYR